jgi:flagellar motor switch/type III secretory pathway protein FliN
MSSMVAEAASVERLALATAGGEPEKQVQTAFSLRGYIPRERWDSCLDIPLHLSVLVPMPRMSLQGLLGLKAGQIVEAGWPASADVPLLVEEMFLANGELEPVGEKLGVRINGFDEQPRPTLHAAVSSPDAGEAESWVESEKSTSLEDLKLVPQLRFGHAEVPMRDVLGLCVGDVLILNRPVIAPVTLAAGGRVVASGELVLVHGGYAIRIDEVAGLARHLPSDDMAF